MTNGHFHSVLSSYRSATFVYYQLVVSNWHSPIQSDSHAIISRKARGSVHSVSDPRRKMSHWSVVWMSREVFSSGIYEEREFWDVSISIDRHNQWLRNKDVLSSRDHHRSTLANPMLTIEYWMLVWTDQSCCSISFYSEVMLSQNPAKASSVSRDRRHRSKSGDQ